MTVIMLCFSTFKLVDKNSHNQFQDCHLKNLINTVQLPGCNDDELTISEADRKSHDTSILVPYTSLTMGEEIGQGLVALVPFHYYLV